MQTFMPYNDFWEVAKSLDRLRLGKQRVEGRQILNALRNNTGWRHHPIVKMWAGYEPALIHYSNVMIIEWVLRGYNNTMPIILIDPGPMPDWVNDIELNLSHQSNLIRKNPDYYRPIFGADVPDNLPYIWM